MRLIGRILLAYLFIAVPFYAYADEVDEKPITANFDLLTDSYKTYLRHPSDDNAISVTDLVMSLVDNKADTQ